MFKKITLIIALFCISFTSFSQVDSFSQDIHKLMKVKNGMGMYNSITDELSKNMEASKASEFHKIMDEEVATSLDQATLLLKENFSHRDIIYIYSEMISDTKKYSDKTIQYIKLWNRHKAAFSVKAKSLYTKFSY